MTEKRASLIGIFNNSRLIGIERIRLDSHFSQAYLQCNALREVCAVVVCGPKETYALDCQGRRIHVAGLLEEVSGLSALLD